MVAAQFVCAGERLRERDVGRECGVDFDGGGTGGREDLCGCYGQGEDVGDVGFGGLAHVCPLFGGVAWTYHHPLCGL